MLKNYSYYAHNYAQKFATVPMSCYFVMDNDKPWLMNNWLNVKSTHCALRVWLHCKLITVVADNYLMPYQWHRLFYYCKSTFFCGMHFCLQYDNYYTSIMLDAFRHLLCSKLCQHNRLVPITPNGFVLEQACFML